MAIIKCKMCGGDLELIEGQSVAECEYCSSRQTVPTADNEKKLIQFERAERLRKNCEFDKAATLYEAIVAEFRQEAEAYWGMVLCKYGIEYVDDPGTGKKIPTCHRVSFDSVLDDSNLELAMENADTVAQKVYREEAKQIERIRRGILEISSTEKTYDIFICYKETAEDGGRTVDSLLAQDIYETLTEKGYRVFFSRITLEDKLGEAYEPYIFAALNSAKIMLAVGTCYEYYNAVWVKNEWSRYLKIIAQDKSKFLIPCYKNIDPYDIPKEFQHLQGQDMGKVGAMQDLLRGIEKILPREEKKVVVQETVVVGGAAGNKIVAALERGNMALEDGEWAKADSFFEDVLSNDAKNAQAYLGKTLAQGKCRNLEEWTANRLEASKTARSKKLTLAPDKAHVEEMAAQNQIPGYLEAEKIRSLYAMDLVYLSEVEERTRQQKNEEIYWSTHKLLTKAEKFAQGEVAEAIAREKKRVFDELAQRVKKAEETDKTNIQNLKARYAAHLTKADAKAEELHRDAESRREKDYEENLKTSKNTQDPAVLDTCAEKFEALGAYRDSKALAEHCVKRTQEIREERRLAEAKAAEEYRRRKAEEDARRAEEEERRIIAQRKAEREEKARKKKIGIVFAAAAAVVLAVGLLINQVILPSDNYKKAVALMENGRYEAAIAAFENLDGFKDSEEQIHKCKTAILDNQYNEAVALMENDQFADAIVAFRKLDGYRDSAEQILKCETTILENQYNEAVALMENGQYEEAIAAFSFLREYKDSQTQVFNCKYIIAANLMENGQYEEAIAAFEALNGYSDSGEMILLCNYHAAEKLLAEADKFGAAVAFRKLGDYKDAANRSDALWAEITVRDTIGPGVYHTVGLKDDGTVVAAGWNEYGQCDVSSWTGIVAISAGDYHTVGLKADGTAVTVGLKEDGQCNVSGWMDIMAISAGGSHTVGLISDGTVVARGNNDYGQCDVESWSWTDIVAISAGGHHTVGLKADGTVVATFCNGIFDYGQCDVSAWTDIVAISAGGNQTVGLKADGTLVAAGWNNYGQCDVGEWTDIVEISASGLHTVGLKADGTVVAVGYNEYGQCNVSSWTDIVAIATSGGNTVGLKADGTVVTVGNNYRGQCNVDDWSGIKQP